MTLTFADAGDAYLAVLAVVVGADQVGSLAEREFLFTDVRTLPVFGGPDRQAFGTRLARVTDEVYGALPTEDGVVTGAGVDTLLAEVRGVLDDELRTSLVEVAGRLGAVDGLDGAERDLLDRLRGALL